MKPLMHRTTFIAAAAALVSLSALFIATDSSAKQMRGHALELALNSCMLADDAKSAETESRWGCCSRSAGICVVCPKPSTADTPCDVTNYRLDVGLRSQPMSASRIESLRQQLRLPPSATKAPNAAAPARAPLAPGVLPNSK
jgi:hypothetical protein